MNLSEAVRRVPPLAVLLVVTLVCYLPALGNGFAQDDVWLVQVEGNQGAANPMVASWQGIASYFASFYWAGVNQADDLYRPLTILSLAATHALCGARVVSEAFPHHALNVLLHLLAVALVWRLLGVLGCGRWARGAGTAVFALHAVRSEAVACVVGRSELLAFTCGAGALLLFLGRDRARGMRRALALGGCALCLFLAFSSKESALAWAPLLACGGIANGERPGAAARSALLVAAVPVAAFFVLRAHAIADPATVPATLPVVNPLVELPVPRRVATALVVQAYALGKTLWPLGLVCDHGMVTFTMRFGLLEPAVLLALGLQAALVAAGVLCARRRPLWFLAVAVFFGGAFVASNLAFTTGVIFAERLLYTPALALSLVVAALATTPWRALPVLLWLVPSVVELEARVPAWRDDATLFVGDVRRNPRSVRLLTAAAATVRGQGIEHLPEAMGYLRAATALEPEFAQAWNNLGAMLLDAGDVDGAEQALQRAATARLRIPREDDRLLAMNQGAVLLRRGKPAAALPLLVHALEVDAASMPAWEDARAAAEQVGWLSAGQQPAYGPGLLLYLSGMLLLTGGRTAEAEARLAAALRAEPGNFRAAFACADAMLAQGKRGPAAALLDGLAAARHAPPEVQERARAEAKRIRRE